MALLKLCELCRKQEVRSYARVKNNNVSLCYECAYKQLLDEKSKLEERINELEEQLKKREELIQLLSADVYEQYFKPYRSEHELRRKQTSN